MTTNGTVSRWCIPKREPKFRRAVYRRVVVIFHPVLPPKLTQNQHERVDTSKIRYPPSEIQQKTLFTFQLRVPGLQNHSTWIHCILEKNTSRVPDPYILHVFTL